MTKTFLVERKADCDDMEEKVSELQKYQKVCIVNGYAFCTCMGYFHTGLPCEHSLMIAITERCKILIHHRWSKQYDELMSEMEEGSRNERVGKLHDQVMLEQKLIYAQFSKTTAPHAVKKPTPVNGDDNMEESEDEEEADDKR